MAVAMIAAVDFVFLVQPVLCSALEQISTTNEMNTKSKSIDSDFSLDIPIGATQT